MNLISEDEFLQRALQVPMQRMQWNLAERFGQEIVIRRDDLVDSSLSGNKFYKLFYNLQRAKSLGHRQVLSFGGAYSNHLHALAAAGRDAQFKTIAVIRGERPKLLSPMLQDIERWGTQLHFVSRADYRLNTEPDFIEGLRATYGDFYTIPEGGGNALGVQGAQAIGWALDQRLRGDYAMACLACGTGSTLAGVAAGIAGSRPGIEPAATAGASEFPLAIGFSVLKGAGGLGESIVSQHRQQGLILANWRLISGYHGGGYGKKLPGYLHTFCHSIERETGIPFDPVYTLKMCWGVAQLLQQGYWPRGSRLVLIHTGGLQGRRTALNP